MNKEKKLIPELRFPEFVGVEDWMVQKLGDIAVFINGRAYKQNELLSNGKYRVLRVGNFFTNNEWYYSDLELDDGKYCEKGDLLFAWSASFGPRMWNEEKVIYHYHIWKVENKKDINRQFLFNLLDYETLRMKSQSLNGFALMHITKGTIENWESTLPKSEKEQQKIASCLSSLDELITAHTDKLQTLKDHKKGLMQNLFPQEGQREPNYRFPEFEDDEDWINTTVEDNCLLKGRIGYRGYTKQDLVKEGEGALVLGGKHIQNQLLDLSDPTFLSWEKYYESPEIMVEANHIIFSQRGSLGDCAIIDREIGKATINPSMVLIKNISCNPRFLYYVLIGDKIQSEVSKNMSLGAIPMLSQKQIKEFQFFIPKPEEQKKIASCLSALDELITAQSEKIEQLQQHKKGLMQGLFPKI